jgi:uncharacterized repeat protein (TIGR03803 family)
MRKVGFVRIACIVNLFCFATAVASHAQTFNTLFSFDNTNGAGPSGPLVQGFNGSFFETTAGGGSSSNCMFKIGCGTVFEITPGGKLSTLYNFCSQGHCADGGNPESQLLLGANGNFYGTTNYGGTNNNEEFCSELGCGTIFEITEGGQHTILYNFCSLANCADGVNPSGLVEAPSANFYGTTNSGGLFSNKANCTNGCGTFFEITPVGLTTLYNFCSQTNCSDGAAPQSGLIQGTDGNFYGVTEAGGAYSSGTAFKITPGGKLTTLYSFCAHSSGETCLDGSSPVGALIQAGNGDFYGTTWAGGTNNGGTLFELSPSGQLTTVYSFCSLSNCADGYELASPVVQGTDGNFYGTTILGGSANYGTAFQITPNGQLTTLYNFCSEAKCTDGMYPKALVQSTNGTFYGTANGGTRQHCLGNGCGIIYSLSTGLGPFVNPVPNRGTVGLFMTILGNKLTGTTSVTFNGTAAAFSAVSDTAIKAIVPTGATTGPIEVTTPTGTLKSNVSFVIE